MEDSSFFFQSNSPLALMISPCLLIGNGTFSATYSLPNVRMILIRPSASRADGESACSDSVTPPQKRNPLTQTEKKRPEGIGHVPGDNSLDYRPKKGPSREIVGRGSVWKFAISARRSQSKID